MWKWFCLLIWSQEKFTVKINKIIIAEYTMQYQIYYQYQYYIFYILISNFIIYWFQEGNAIEK